MRQTELGLKYVPFPRFVISAVKHTSNESITVNIVQNSHHKSNPEKEGREFLQISLFQPDFYTAAMFMRSAAPIFPQINHLAIKIPQPDFMTEMAIKIILKIQQKTNLKTPPQTIKIEMIQNKSVSFPSTQAEWRHFVFLPVSMAYSLSCPAAAVMSVPVFLPRRVSASWGSLQQQSVLCLCVGHWATSHTDTAK